MDMKKFSLKPLGDSCMKMLCKSCFFIGLLMTFCLTACSDDDDDTVAPIFPEKQNIVCNAGETKEFTFTANTNWSLASSAIWCKFQTNDMEEFVVSGTAGTQTVTIIATDDNQKVDNISVAKLELTMGGQTIVIGEVTRSAVGYDLKIYDEAGVEIKELKVGYKDFSKFSVQANFRFAATNLPGWVELEGGSLVGAVDQKVNGGLKIVEDNNREKYPVAATDKNVITFSDEEGKAFYSFKVSYDGMTPGVMEMTLPSTYATNWIVSMDGKTFTQKSSGGSTSDATIQKRMPFTIKTLNDDYEIVYMEEWEDWQGTKNISVIDPSMLWMHCEGEKGKVNLTIDQYSPNTAWGDPETRTGYVLVFSRAEYESIKDNLEETVVENGEIAYKYEQGNLLIGFTQKEVKEETDNQAFKVTYYDADWALQEATYTKADHDYDYGIEDVYIMKQPDSAGRALTVNPLMDGSYETDWTVQIWCGDDDVTKEYIDPLEKEFTIDNSKPLTQDLHICIKQNYMNVKVLIITPNE